MTDEMIMKLAGLYRSRLMSMGVRKVSLRLDQAPHSKRTILGYCLTRLEEVEALIRVCRPIEAKIALEFVRCSLWAAGIYSEKRLHRHMEQRFYTYRL